jgi:hypothetical protein
MLSAVMLNAVMVNVVAPLVVLAQSCHILTEITSNSETDVSSVFVQFLEHQNNKHFDWNSALQKI